MSLYVLFGICLYLMLYVQENEIAAKNLQCVSGLSMFVYWICSLIWDLLMWLVCASMMLIYFAVVLNEMPDKPGITRGEVIVGVFVVLMLFAWSILPFLYLWSFFFKNALFATILAVMVISIVGTNALFGGDGFILTPQRSRYLYYYSLNRGLSIPFMNYVSGDNGSKQKVDNVDSDIMHAVEHIQTTDLKALKQENKVLLINVTKRFHKFVAVNNVNLAVQPGECFGLLGVNGAGKTTTFNMIVGNIMSSSGRIYINGHSVKSPFRKAYQSVGYCPQFDAVLPQLTVKQNLTLYCLIRGVPRSRIPLVIDDLAHTLQFKQHMKKRLKQCSGGTQRKLSTCVAILGNPMVVLLDEPSSGMDPESRRMLWNLIISKGKNSCVILTSHHMEECEALSTRLAIMVRGQFRCMGSTQHLKAKFSKGYILFIKAIDNLEPIMEFVEKTFEGAVLEETHFNLVKYSVPVGKMTQSQMYGVMEQAKKQLNIEDYSLGQTNLDEVFLLFAKDNEKAD